MLNLDASINIPYIVVTFLTFQRDMSLLKELALWNMFCMDVTWSVRQEETSPLNLDAPENILDMDVTWSVRQAETSPLNDVAW